MAVEVDEVDVPGSMSSFGFIGNPVRVKFLTGARVLLPPAGSFLPGDFVTFVTVLEIVSLVSDVVVAGPVTYPVKPNRLETDE